MIGQDQNPAAEPKPFLARVGAGVKVHRAWSNYPGHVSCGAENTNNVRWNSRITKVGDPTPELLVRCAPNLCKWCFPNYSAETR